MGNLPGAARHKLLVAAFVLGVPEQKVRVIAPDVGGGFGSKIFIYFDMPLVLWLSKQLGRPVKYFEDRTENYLHTTHGRDHHTDIEIGATTDGKITALKVSTLANLGAYLSTIAPGIPTTLYGRMVAGCYKIPNIHVDVKGVYTNTAMVDAYRGAGRPEATFVIERTCDLVADATGIDPAEVRRRNFIQPEDFPYDTGLGMLPYDSGNYAPALDKALQQVGYAEPARGAARRRANGSSKLLGIGLSSYVEVCGIAPSKWIGLSGEGWGAGLWESAEVRVYLTGKVSVTTGSLPHGQGHETTFAQLVSDELGSRTRTSRSSTPTPRHTLRLWLLRQSLAGRRRHGDLQERAEGRRKGQAAGGPHARGGAGGHRLRERQGLGEGIA